MHKTTYRKGRDGGHEAKTLIPLPGVVTKSANGKGGETMLVIYTYKSSKGLASIASVEHHDEHIVSFVLYGDYRKTVAQSKARCTEKAVAALHAESLAKVSAITEDAIAFYRK